MKKGENTNAKTGKPSVIALVFFKFEKNLVSRRVKNVKILKNLLKNREKN